MSTYKVCDIKILEGVLNWHLLSLLELLLLQFFLQLFTFNGILKVVFVAVKEYVPSHCLLAVDGLKGDQRCVVLCLYINYSSIDDVHEHLLLEVEFGFLDVGCSSQEVGVVDQILSSKFVKSIDCTLANL